MITSIFKNFILGLLIAICSFTALEATSHKYDEECSDDTLVHYRDQVKEAIEEDSLFFPKEKISQDMLEDLVRALKAKNVNDTTQLTYQGFVNLVDELLDSPEIAQSSGASPHYASKDLGEFVVKMQTKIDNGTINEWGLVKDSEEVKHPSSIGKFVMDSGIYVDWSTLPNIGLINRIKEYLPTIELLEQIKAKLDSGAIKDEDRDDALKNDEIRTAATEVLGEKVNVPSYPWSKLLADVKGLLPKDVARNYK